MQPVPAGFLETITPAEKEVMLRVKAWLRETYGINCKRVWNHWNILRFCRARKFDFPKIAEMIKNYMDWCSQIQMSNIGLVDMKQYDHLKTLYNHGYYNVDRAGRPVYIEEIRKIQADHLFKSYTDDQLTKYYVQSYERLLHIIFPECSRAAGYRVEQTCAIIELKDVNILKLFGGKVRAFMNIAINIGQNYYPECMAQMYILHAGFLFSGIWAVVKGWVDPKTQQKINIISGNGHKELQKAIAPENLPVFLGGTCQKELTEDYGPWHAELKKSYERQSVFHSDPTIIEQYFWDAEEKAEEAKLRGSQKALDNTAHSEQIHEAHSLPRPQI